MRYEEEIKPIQSINSWTETKVPSTMWEEQKDCDLLFREVKKVTESSRLSASSSDEKKPLVI